MIDPHVSASSLRRVAAGAVGTGCLAVLAMLTPAGPPVEVRSADGRARLTLEADVVPAGTVVRLVPDTGAADPAAVAGSRYRVEPVDAHFRRPATLTVTYDTAGMPAGVPESTLALVRNDGATWTPLAPPARPGPHTVAGGVVGGGPVAVRWHAGHARCTAPEYHALDFRLGTWAYRAEGYDPGRAVVTADPSGCALFEAYADVTGGRSSSFFAYDPADRQWHATTIDPGGRAVTRGGPEGGRVVFYHSPTDREAYEARGDGAVAFAGERSADAGRTWATWVTATYTRAPASPP